MRLSIVIPARNEEECICEVLRKLTDVLEKEVREYEIIVVDDNSPDRTSNLLSRVITSPPALSFTLSHSLSTL